MKYLIYIILVYTVATSCNSENENTRSYQQLDVLEVSRSDDESGEQYENESSEIDKKEEKEVKDGVYSATVDYYNPSTGYTTTYTLDVEVDDNMVVLIYFDNGGYLDDVYFYPDELDEDGYVFIEAYDGRTFDIQIDL